MKSGIPVPSGCFALAKEVVKESNSADTAKL